jgi:hypothetical protein
MRALQQKEEDAKASMGWLTKSGGLAATQQWCGGALVNG